MHKKLLPLCCLLLTLMLTACTREVEPVSATTVLLDTVCTVTLYEPADEELLQQTIDLCAKYESLFSRTVEGSDVYRINQAAEAPVEVDPLTADLIRLGLYYGELSDGLFDITVGQLSTLWDFGGANHLPTQEEIDAALATVDYRQVNIDGNRVWMDNPQAMLELGGIAKGYIGQLLADFLREKGVESALLDLGGNIVTIGEKADGTPWNIGVEQPFSNRSSLAGTVCVGEAAVVTSGIYERQFEVDGVLYHHILDPRTGWPADNEVAGVTIVADDSAAADALSTICLLLGHEKGDALLAQQDGVQGAVWVDKEGAIALSGDVDFR